jgi:hypothetical protein
MPTTDAKTQTSPTDAAFEWFNEQFLATARRAGNLYLDAYEKTVDRTIELEVELAGLTQQEWLRDVIQAQTDLAREITSSYTTTARSLLR